MDAYREQDGANIQQENVGTRRTISEVGMMMPKYMPDLSNVQAKYRYCMRISGDPWEAEDLRGCHDKGDASR